MKIMSYLCQAERQVLVKAYASSLDLNLNAPSRGIQVCRTSKTPVMRVQRLSLQADRQQNCTAFSLVSIKSVRLCNMRLVI